MVKRTIVPAAGVLAALTLAACGTTTVETTQAQAPTAPATTAVAPTTPTAPTPTTGTSTGFTPSPTTPTVASPTVPAPTTPTPTFDTTPTPTRPQRPRHLRPGAHVVPVSTYTRDVLQSLTALRGFSSTLQSIDSPSEFSARLPSLRRDLRTFDGMIRRLRSYQLMSPELDRQRSRLAQQGPGLARTMSDFLDSVRDGNVTRARQLASEIQTRLNRFRKSA